MGRYGGGCRGRSNNLVRDAATAHGMKSLANLLDPNSTVWLNDESNCKLLVELFEDCAKEWKGSNIMCDTLCAYYRERLSLLCPNEGAKVIPIYCPDEASNKKKT